MKIKIILNTKYLVAKKNKYILKFPLKAIMIRNSNGIVLLLTN